MKEQLRAHAICSDKFQQLGFDRTICAHCARKLFIYKKNSPKF